MKQKKQILVYECFNKDYKIDDLTNVSTELLKWRPMHWQMKKNT